VGTFNTSLNRTIEYSPEEVIHIKADSSTNEFRGDSKLLSLKRLIELYYSLIEFQKQFFQK